jgi:hypothetical protein
VPWTEKSVCDDGMRGTHRCGDNPVKVAGPENNARGCVSGLVLDAQASPHGVVGACSDRSDEEGQNVGDGVDLAGDAHVEEDNGTDEHAQEANKEEVANRVGVVIREGNNRLLLACSLLLEHGAPVHGRKCLSQKAGACPDTYSPKNQLRRSAA